MRRVLMNKRWYLLILNNGTGTVCCHRGRVQVYYSPSIFIQFTQCSNVRVFEHRCFTCTRLPLTCLGALTSLPFGLLLAIIPCFSAGGQITLHARIAGAKVVLEEAYQYRPHSLLATDC